MCVTHVARAALRPASGCAVRDAAGESEEGRSFHPPGGRGCLNTTYSFMMFSDVRRLKEEWNTDSNLRANVFNSIGFTYMCIDGGDEKSFASE